MSSISVIGLDIAKHVFQIHGIDESGAVIVRRQLRRGQMLGYFANLRPCLIGLEACATGHYWGRELGALGHDVRLIPPQYVKPYVKRNKTDAADAEAICEALTRPSMHFVGIKSMDQQAVMALHRTRDLLVRQRTMAINALRGHMAEFGVVEAQGIAGAKRLVAVLADETDERIPPLARRVLAVLVEQLRGAMARIAALEREMKAWHKASEVSQRLATIPGVGPVTATALAATVPDASVFSSGRQFAAWLGLVPRQHSTGGKPRLGGISKRGDGYLRRLLMTGATAALRRSRQTRARPWVRDLLKRRPAKVVAVALANKTARTAWAMMKTGEAYRAPKPAAT
jgi:transposase